MAVMQTNALYSFSLTHKKRPPPLPCEIVRGDEGKSTIHSFSHYTGNRCYVPAIAQGMKNTSMQTDKRPASRAVSIWEEAVSSFRNG
jgi:hypothetical protein